MKIRKIFFLIVMLGVLGLCGCSKSDNETEALKNQMEELQKQNEELSNKLDEMTQKTDVEITEALEATMTLLPTSTPEPTLEPTSEPTSTSVLTNTPTPVLTPACTPLLTPVPTSTPAPTSTPKPTATPKTVDITYDFNDLKQPDSYKLSYNVDSDGTLYIEFKEESGSSIMFTLPNEIDLSQCLGVTVKMKSELANIVIFLRDKITVPVTKIRDCHTKGIENLYIDTSELKKKVHYIDFFVSEVLQTDASVYDVTVYNVTFHMKEGYEVNSKPTATPSPLGDSDTRIVVSSEEMERLRKEVSLTTEDFDKYFDVVEEKYIELDAFDEPTGTEYICQKVVLKNGYGIAEKTTVEINYETVSNGKIVNAETGEELDNMVYGLDIFAYDAIGVEKVVENTGILYFNHESPQNLYQVASHGNTTSSSLIKKIPLKDDKTKSRIVHIGNDFKGDLIYDINTELTKFEVTRIKGRIYEWDIPEDYWNMDENSLRYILVHNGWTLCRWYEDGIFYFEDTSNRKNAAPNKWFSIEFE